MATTLFRYRFCQKQQQQPRDFMELPKMELEWAGGFRGLVTSRDTKKKLTKCCLRTWSSINSWYHRRFYRKIHMEKMMIPFVFVSGKLGNSDSSWREAELLQHSNYYFARSELQHILDISLNTWFELRPGLQKLQFKSCAVSYHNFSLHAPFFDWHYTADIDPQHKL